MSSASDRVYLAKKYGIEYSDLFNAYVCDDQTFETLDDALAHARDLESASKDKATSARRMWIGAVTIAVLGGVAGYWLNQTTDQKRSDRAEQLNVKSGEQVKAVSKPKLANKAKPAVDAAFLIGGWVNHESKSAPKSSELPMICATDDSVIFNAGGKYSYYREDGQFSVANGRIIYTHRLEYPDNVEDHPTPIELEDSSAKVEMIDRGRIKIDGSQFVRCP